MLDAGDHHVERIAAEVDDAHFAVVAEPSERIIPRALEHKRLPLEANKTSGTDVTRRALLLLAATVDPECPRLSITIGVGLLAAIVQLLVA